MKISEKFSLRKFVDSSIDKLTIGKKRKKNGIVGPPSKHLGTITTDPQLFVLCDDNATRKMVSLAGYSTTVRKHKSITRRTGSSTGYVPRNFTISFIARGFTRHNFVVLVFLVDMSEITLGGSSQGNREENFRAIFRRRRLLFFLSLFLFGSLSLFAMSLVRKLFEISGKNFNLNFVLTMTCKINVQFVKKKEKRYSNDVIFNKTIVKRV